MTNSTLTLQDELDEIRTLGIRVEMVTPYQIRFDGVLDVWMKRHKFHAIPEKQRGSFLSLIPFVRTYFTRGL